MKNTWPIWLSLFLLSGCLEVGQPKKELINDYLRPLTEQELQAEADKRDAEIIFQMPDDVETFVILDTGEKILHGSFTAMVFEFDDQTSDASINYSLFEVSRNPKVKVSVYSGTRFRMNQGEKISRGEIVVWMHDAEIQENIEKMKVIFQDESQIFTPAKGKKGIYFTYDVIKNPTSLELLSQTDEVLYSRKL